MRTVEVTDDLQAYLDGLVPTRDAVLARMEEEADREGIPIVEPHEGSLLYLLVKIAGAKRILELGTATGYSGIWMLRGSGGGTLTTYETDHDRAQRARANFGEAGFGKAAIVLEENAKDGLEKLEGRFDACFIDLLNSVKPEEITRRVLELCIERLEGGGPKGRRGHLAAPSPASPVVPMNGEECTSRRPVSLRRPRSRKCRRRRAPSSRSAHFP